MTLVVGVSGPADRLASIDRRVTMTTPILAQLRDAAEQRGWVRGLTFSDIVERSGREPEQAASALRAWRLAGTIKFTEQHAGDPETITALRITKEARALSTTEASKIEADMLGSMPEDQAALIDVMATPPARRKRTVSQPVVEMNEALLVQAKGQIDELQQRLREGDTFPAIRELIAREAEMLEAAATFERHGMADLAEAAMERLKNQTPLEQDVIRLHKVLMGW